MSWFDQHCAVLTAPNAIVHIGAGTGSDLSTYLRFPGTQVLLVEPQPHFANRLRKNTVDQKNIEVVQAAVSDKTGQQQLNILSLPALSSLQRPANGLSTLMPSLRSDRAQQVDTITIDQLAEDFEINANDRNWLIIDAPGMETVLAEAASKSAPKPLFQHLFLRCSPADSYANGGSVNELLGLLGKRGFEVVGNEDPSDPDWRFFHLRFNEHLKASIDLAQQIEGLKDRCDEAAMQQKALEKTQAELEAHGKGLSEKLQIREKELSALRDESEQKIEDLTREATRLNLETVQLKTVHEQNIEDLTGKLQRRDKQLADTCTDSEQRIESLTGDLTKRDQEIVNLNTAIKESTATLALNDDIEAAEQHSIRLENDLQQARADLSVSLRTQAMKEADLKELRTRYGVLREQKIKQQELLTELGARLKAAAEILKSLELKGTNTDGDQKIPNQLIRVLSGELEP